MLVETMQSRNVTVDLYTLNSLLKACGNAGQIERERSPNSSFPLGRPSSLCRPAYHALGRPCLKVNAFFSCSRRPFVETQLSSFVLATVPPLCWRVPAPAQNSSHRIAMDHAV